MTPDVRDGELRDEVLREAERRVLRLFAQGHSAKSAAAELGLSVNAVNERLRAARRRTGVGSSRELARLLATQENRDEVFGLSETATAASPLPRNREGMTMMMIAGTIGAGVAAAAMLATSTDRAADGSPRVVRIVPASGAVVPAGPLTVTVTFDRPMRGDGWSFTTSDRGAYPRCDGAPRRSPDRRTFTLGCTVEKGGRYAIGINGGRFRNFVGENGVPAVAAETVFGAR